MSYWEKRQEEAYKAGEMQVNQYFMRLEKAFNQAKREIQKTVESFYWRYAKENGLTYSEAQKRLDKAELGELKDFVEKAMNNIGKYNQDVNNMSIKARMCKVTNFIWKTGQDDPLSGIGSAGGRDPPGTVCCGV